MALKATILASACLTCTGSGFRTEAGRRNLESLNTIGRPAADLPSKNLMQFLLLLKPMMPPKSTVPVTTAASATEVQQHMQKSCGGQTSQFRKRARPHKLRTSRIVAKADAEPPKLRQLPFMMTVNLIAATLASLAISSIPISILDAAIVRTVAGATSLSEGIMHSVRQLIFAPHTFFDLGYLVVFLVYVATYFSANVADSTIGIIKGDRVKTRARERALKLVMTSVVNIIACARKDQLFSRWFSTGPAHAVPLITTLLFCFRDMLTMLCAFTLPEPLEEFLRKEMKITANWVGFAASLLPVVLVQIISTPIHLVALGIYNGAPSLLAVLKMNYLPAVLTRSMRAVPLGLGAAGNTRIKKEIYKLLNVTAVA